MITLYKYLRESLLDDFDNLEKSSDKKVFNSITRDPDFVSIFGEGWIIKNNSLISPEVSSRRHPRIEFNPQLPIRQLIPDMVDKIVINFNSGAIRHGNNTRLSIGEISNQTVCDKIIHNGKGIFEIAVPKIKNIDFDLNSHKLTFPICYPQLEFNNVNINFRNKGSAIYIHASLFPKFINTTSNASNLSMYDASIFNMDESIKLIDKILDLPYNVAVYDNVQKTDIEIPIKTFKKIHAIVNNKKRYILKEPLIKIKPNSSLNDIMDLSGFNDLQFITIENNSINITLAKGDVLKTHTRFWHNDNRKFALGDWSGYIKKV